MATIGSGQCPLCQTTCTISFRDDSDSREYRVQCPACHVYFLDVLSEDAIRSLNSVVRYRLCAVAREMSDNGRPIELDAENYEEISTRARRWTLLSDGIDRLLAELARHVGDRRRDIINFNANTDFPLIACRGPAEVQDLIAFAVDRDFIAPGMLVITLAGWERVERLQSTNPQSRQAFVAMWFDRSMRDAYTLGFKLAIEASNYFTAVRVDTLEYNEGVDDRIIAEIRRSAFLVADFTGSRSGVYFEAGYALGLGLPVIWTCKEDQVGDLHFDVRQKNHVIWKDHEELVEKLDRRIRATVLPVGWR